MIGGVQGESDEQVLFVIDIQSGDIVQRARLDFATGAISAILVDGDEIFISMFDADEVAVLHLAGSEA